MLFKWELIEKIVRGEKVQTRRLIKAGEVLRQMESPHGGYEPIAVLQNGRKKIAVNTHYAVQYGRGKPTVQYQKYRGESRMVRDVMSYDFYQNMVDKHGDNAQNFLSHYGYKPLRILITDIRREDVRKIHHNDAVAEGFSIGRIGFWKTWCGFYDPRVLDCLSATDYDSAARDLLDKRPNELYQAWAYTFEVV